GRLAQFVTVADVNADGFLDLAVANFASANVSVLLGNGDGTFQTARHFSTVTGPRSLAVADVNADGPLDLIALDGAARVLLGNGDGTFVTTWVSYAAGRGATAVVVADFDYDSFLDLAVANGESNDVSLLFNDGIWRRPGPGGAPGDGAAPGSGLGP